jgi:methylthioribose-1-phosphate isomerase
MGVALGVRVSKAETISALREDFKQITDTLASTRPTAVNLFWAIERMKRLFKEIGTDTANKKAIADRLIKEAVAIQAEDIESNKRMGQFGHALQCRRSGNCGIWNRAGRYSCGRRKRQASARSC